MSDIRVLSLLGGLNIKLLATPQLIITQTSFSNDGVDVDIEMNDGIYIVLGQNNNGIKGVNGYKGSYYKKYDFLGISASQSLSENYLKFGYLILSKGILSLANVNAGDGSDRNVSLGYADFEVPKINSISFFWNQGHGSGRLSIYKIADIG